MDITKAIFGFSVSPTMAWIVLAAFLLLIGIINTFNVKPKRRNYRNYRQSTYVYRPSKAERQYYNNVVKPYRPKVRFKRPTAKFKR